MLGTTVKITAGEHAGKTAKVTDVCESTRGVHLSVEGNMLWNGNFSKFPMEWTEPFTTEISDQQLKQIENLIRSDKRAREASEKKASKFAPHTKVAERARVNALLHDARVDAILQTLKILGIETSETRY